MAPRRVAAAVFSVLLGCTAAPAFAQVSLDALDAPYTQDFDSLISSGSAQWANDSTIPGWFHARSGSGTTIVAGDGSSNTGALYSFGTTGSSDRALGSVGSGTPGDLYWGVRLQNNTGATITSLDVAYTGEEWRNSAAAAQTVAFSYLVGSPTVTGSLAEFQSAGVAVTNLDFTSPVTAGTAGALDGNAAANRQAITYTISGLSIADGTEVMLRWSDPNHSGSDHGLSIDDFSVTPHGEGAAAGLAIANVSMNEGDSGTTTFTFTVSLSEPAPVGGVGFDIATADGTATAPSDYTAVALTGQVIPAGQSTYTFDVLVNGDTTYEPNETFFVNVTNITGISADDAQATGTIVNDDFQSLKIHDLQGSGSATPIPSGTVVSVEGVVTGSYQGSGKLSGFFLQEEDADADADPNTSEGIFVYCGACATAVTEGQRVAATGTVTEYFGMTELNATSAAAVVVTDAGNHLDEVTPTPITLPIAGDVDAFYEAREGMLVTYVDPLFVSEYYAYARYGQIELYAGSRPRQFTEFNAPDVTGNAAYQAELARSHVILDDENNTENWPLTLPEGEQYLYYPHANGGFSAGTQGVDFFRGGDRVDGLTGVLHWSFAGTSGTDAWRIRPVQATPATFTVANPRPATPPDVHGWIRAVGMNMLNYFTTIDTTSSSSSGPCGPSGTLDCRGADSEAELDRQRERASVVLCDLDPDVAALMEMENTTPTDTINDLLGAVNARCGGPHPYTFVDTGGTLGTDAIRVMLIYRTGVLAPVGTPLVDTDSVNSRPPTAQTFDVVDSSNAAFGERFTVVANHLKSKGCSSSSGGDVDSGDGQGCYAARRTAQATRLLDWVENTVIPAAGDSDVLLLGDFNSYAQETPVTTITDGGYTDLETTLLGDAAYSYLYNGQLGHLDYAFSSASLTSQITGVAPWHINADEVPLFDYNDDVLDAGESAYEEKPDGSALMPARVLFEPATPYRASDHDPVLVGLFGGTAPADLAAAITASPDPVTAGTSLTYTITITNNGPGNAVDPAWTDTLPVGTTFVSLSGDADWTCTTPAVGATGTVECGADGLAVGSAAFTLVVAVDAGVASGSSLSDTVTVSAATEDNIPGNDSATASTDVATSADLSATMTDTPDPVLPGGTLTYTITVANAGPSAAANAVLLDTLPEGITFASLNAPAGWICTTPAVGDSGAVSCSQASFAPGSVEFTLATTVSTSVPADTVLSNTATIASATNDPNPGNESATATTTVHLGQLSITPTSLDFGDQLVGSTSAAMTVTLANTGSAPLDVMSVTEAAAPFARSGGNCPTTTPFTLADGTSCTLDYTFSPTATGAANQVLTIVAFAPGSGTVTLSGNGSLPAEADIALTIDDGRDFVQVGDMLDYVITVSNAAGPATASVQVGDALPAGLSDGSWTCVPNGAATCAGGSGDSLSDTATLPPGTSVVYIYSATVQTAAGEQIENTATAIVGGGVTDPNPINNGATDADTVVIFRDGFDDAATIQTLDGSAGDGFASARFGIEATLLDTLGVAPVTVARGLTADAKQAFTIDLARFGSHYALRLVVHAADGTALRSEWFAADLAGDALDLAWQPAAGRDDGYVRAAIGAAAAQFSDRNDARRVVQLRIATGEQGQPWLSLLTE